MLFINHLYRFAIYALICASPSIGMTIYTSNDVIQTTYVGTGNYSTQQHLDYTVAHSQRGMDASAKQFASYFDYTMNQTTPGFHRTNYANYWNSQTNELESHKFLQISKAPPIQSHNPYHAYIQSRGFFFVQTLQGPAFTSDGRFYRHDPSGQLLSVAGNFPVLDIDNNPIILNDDQIKIASDGAIYAKSDKVAQLRIVFPINIKMVTSLNGVWFQAPPDQLIDVPPAEILIIDQFYEASSVPKGLAAGDTGRYKHMFFANTYTAKRALRGMRSVIRMTTY